MPTLSKPVCVQIRTCPNRMPESQLVESQLQASRVSIILSIVHPSRWIRGGLSPQASCTRFSRSMHMRLTFSLCPAVEPPPLAMRRSSGNPMPM